MTRPTDASIARAFWETYTMQMDGFIDSDSLIVMAEQFDAESPAGTERGSEEAQLPYWLCCGSLNFHEHHRRVCQATPEICRWGTADEHAAWQQSRPDIVFKFPQKVTTSPERVQIPAESKHVPLPEGWVSVKELRAIPEKRTCTIPTCRAEMRPGLRCKNPDCGLA